MFGSYETGQATKPAKNLKLGLIFENGGMFFYTCSVKLIDKESFSHIDWEADVMSKIWNPQKAKEKLLAHPNMMVCDALMRQDIMAGSGNIIKNEVLFRIGV